MLGKIVFIVLFSEIVDSPVLTVYKYNFRNGILKRNSRFSYHRLYERLLIDYPSVTFTKSHFLFIVTHKALLKLLIVIINISRKKIKRFLIHVPCGLTRYPRAYILGKKLLMPRIKRSHMRFSLPLFSRILRIREITPVMLFAVGIRKTSRNLIFGQIHKSAKFLVLIVFLAKRVDSSLIVKEIRRIKYKRHDLFVLVLFLLIKSHKIRMCHNLTLLARKLVYRYGTYHICFVDLITRRIVSRIHYLIRIHIFFCGRICKSNLALVL